jgi:hypothetical protein
MLNIAQGQTQRIQTPDKLMGHRFLTLNTVIRVNQIEAARDINKGMDERQNHTPEAVIAFRESGETLELDIIIHTAKPPKNAALFWKTMGTKEPYQKSELRPVHGNHYATTLPPLDSVRSAIEYYIEAETENPQRTKSLLRFPSTAPELNQTVIVAVGSGKYEFTVQQ